MSSKKLIDDLNNKIIKKIVDINLIAKSSKILNEIIKQIKKVVDRDELKMNIKSKQRQKSLLKSINQILIKVMKKQTQIYREFFKFTTNAIKNLVDQFNN